MNISKLTDGGVVPKQFCIIFMISYIIQFIIILSILGVIVWALVKRKYEFALTLSLLLPAYLYTYIRDRLLYYLCANSQNHM
jgi:hypothetical protein